MAQDLIFFRIGDGPNFKVSFDPDERSLLQQAAEHIRGLLTGVDEVGGTAVLFPPAYGDDWARQVEFDRLTKEELSNSHVAALDTLLRLLDAKQANLDEIEGFAKAINQIRLVFAKPLDLTDDSDDSDFPRSHPLHDTWKIYLYFGYLQSQALHALIGLDDEFDPFEDDDEADDWDSPSNN